MTFVKIENYDGEKGYLERDFFSFHVMDINDKKYLLNFDSIANPSGSAYRIVKEYEDTAIGETIKDKKEIKLLKKKYYSKLEQRKSQEKNSLEGIL